MEKGKDREKEKIGVRPTKLNEKRSDRELEREIKTKEILLLEEKHKTICSGEKMGNTSGHQGENEQQRKKSEQGARSIQPNFPEISVQNSIDRFGSTGKVSKKRIHLLRWSSFPGRTGWNFV